MIPRTERPLLALFLLGALWNTWVPASAHARSACRAPQSVCDARASVFRIKSFDPYGSAVRIGPNLLVTNRHVVADEKLVTIFLGPKVIEGNVVPTSFGGDLVLIRATLPSGPEITIANTDLSPNSVLRTIGYSIAQRDIRVYAEGRVLALPAEGHPMARIHHTATTLPGNSGGALVNATGQLVGIVTSGSAEVFEAVPAASFAQLMATSGPAYATESAETGDAYKACTQATLEAWQTRGKLPAELMAALEGPCLTSRNRQLIDLAAQALGRARNFTQSEAFFLRSLTLDPNAVNTRLGLVVTLMWGRKQTAALPHLRKLLVAIPANLTVHRMAIQAGKQTGDKALVATTLDAIKTHNPRGLEAAQRFLDQPARPSRRLDRIRPRKKKPDEDQ